MPNRPLIAFADDDPDQGHLLSTWLTRRGCHVVPFSTGDDLVDWASATAPPVNAVVLDAEEFPTAEHYMMWRKATLFGDDAILRMPNPITTGSSVWARIGGMAARSASGSAERVPVMPVMAT